MAVVYIYQDSVMQALKIKETRPEVSLSDKVARMMSQIEMKVINFSFYRNCFRTRNSESTDELTMF